METLRSLNAHILYAQDGGGGKNSNTKPFSPITTAAAGLTGTLAIVKGLWLCAHGVSEADGGEIANGIIEIVVGGTTVGAPILLSKRPKDRQ